MIFRGHWEIVQQKTKLLNKWRRKENRNYFKVSVDGNDFETNWMRLSMAKLSYNYYEIAWLLGKEWTNSISKEMILLTEFHVCMLIIMMACLISFWCKLYTEPNGKAWTRWKLAQIDTNTSPTTTYVWATIQTVRNAWKNIEIHWT